MRKLFVFTLLFILMACQAESGPYPQKVEILTAQGEVIKTTLAVTPKEQEQGLSGVQSGDFSDNEGMLFWYHDDLGKMFWMPDTYFDLDLIFTDKDLRILDIIRKLPHYKGRANPDLIPRARTVYARHVLEMKSTSPISAKLKIGDQLKIKGQKLEELDTKIKAALKTDRQTIPQNPR